MNKSERKGSPQPEVLIGIPSMIGFESPASWLTRAALSQGVSPIELASFLGLAADVDMAFAKVSVEHLGAACAVAPSTFAFARHMFRALASIDPDGRTFLLFSKKSSRYRYCPVCLEHQKHKHFPVHWRFMGWRYCPLHACMMEESCRHCGLAVKLPLSLINVPTGKRGIVSLDRCFGCEERLSSHWNRVVNTLSADVLWPGEWAAMARGRAVLSSLYQGHFYWTKTKHRASLRGLVPLAENGTLPHLGFTLTSDELFRRRAQLDDQHWIRRR